MPARPRSTKEDLGDAAGSDCMSATTATQEVSNPGVSVFARAENQPADPILSMRDNFLADPAPQKLNLAVGVYRTAEGKPLVLECVQEAEAKLLEETRKGQRFKEYLPPDGMASFCTSSLKLLLADAIVPAIDDGRVVAAQSLSGTGGLHLAAKMIHELMPGATVHLPSPTWPIHPDIFTAVGLKIAYYPYYDPATCGLAFEDMLAHLRLLPTNSVVLLHACAHNPTGVDPSPEQWRQIARVVAQRALIPLIDSAYQGLASGDLDVDAYGARQLAALPNIEMITVQSYSKNLGLYAERAGVVAMVCNDADVAERVRQTLKRTIRLTHSSPPQHGASIAAHILADDARASVWKGEVKAMAERLLEMRTCLAESLARVDCPPPFGTSLTSWRHVLDQRGMFTYTGLTPPQVDMLREVHHVYMPMDGRICMAGLTKASCDTFAAAVKDVLEFMRVHEATAAAKDGLKGKAEGGSPSADATDMSPPAAKRARA